MIRVSKILAVITALGIPAFVAAETTAKNPCEGEGNVAKLIAQTRLMPGADINDMIARFGEEPAFREMVLQAFELPLITTEPARTRLAEEFGNSWSLNCYRNGPTIPLKSSSE